MEGDDDDNLLSGKRISIPAEEETQRQTFNQQLKSLMDTGSDSSGEFEKVDTSDFMGMQDLGSASQNQFQQQEQKGRNETIMRKSVLQEEQLGQKFESEIGTDTTMMTYFKQDTTTLMVQRNN